MPIATDGRDVPTPGDPVEFLRDRAWPGAEVEVIETHMSWVFLVGDRAYKLKKAAQRPYVDLRTLAARKADCEAEVALNQTLAPGIYLGVEALGADEAGGLALGGDHPVDWLVVMRRFDRDALLDRQIEAGRATTDDLGPVLDTLARFYRAATPQPSDPEDYRRALARQVESDLDELSSAGRRPRIDHEPIGALLLDGITACAELGPRASRLVDGHGDLRPQHIRPGTEPLVLDRLSFDPRLRRLDPYLDLALLAVECERLGAARFGDHVLAGFAARADDPVPGEVLDLYRAIRATTRARLSIAHLHDGDGDGDRWVARCDGYLRIAGSYAGGSGEA